MNLNTMNGIEIQRLHENEQEEKNFKDNLHRLLNGNRQLASRPLVIGKTPYALSICGANGELPLMITKKVIDKCMRPEIRDEKGKLIGKTGHGLTEEEISKLYSQLQIPVLIFYGNHSNSLVVITDQTDSKNRGMLVAIDLNIKDQRHRVNQITTYYGHEHFDYFIKDNIERGNLLAINNEKADKLFQSIGVSFPKEEKFISFNNSIAYTTENVNYPNTRKSNEKEQDDMAVKKNSFNDFQQNNYDLSSTKRTDEDYREPAQALMKKYDYEETYVEGFSDDGFKFIKPIGEGEARGFDGWHMIQEHFEEIDQLVENYTQEQLQKRLNGDYSEIEYGRVSDDQIEAALNKIQENQIVIKGESCRIIDEWEEDGYSFVLGQDNDDENFYYSRVSENGIIKEFEFDHEPSREEIFSYLMDRLAEEDIDRGEAEYGADGYRVFRETQEEDRDQIPHREEKELSKQEQMQQLLKNGVKSVMDSDAFANWCETQGRFFSNHYSFRNSMLVYVQNPEATYVCGYEQWKDFGRQVKKGATAIKIFSPVMARDLTGQGSLYSYVRRQCSDQLKDPAKEYATYRVGRYDFVMYKNGRLFDVKNNKTGGTIGSSWTTEQTKKFIDQYIVGKEPLYYNVQNVFDIKDTVVTDTLYVPKYKATSDEMILNEDGKPITDARGNVKIKNTAERQARFNISEPAVIENDPAKMAILYDVVRQISGNKNIPFSEVARSSDSVLAQGANGYFRLGSNGGPGSITISSDLTPTQKIRTSFHEMAHADLHQNLSKLAEEIGADKPEITRQMKEVQAEAVAFMTANAFGIQTDHKSFTYIAQWSDGRELQALEKSLNIIYKESQRMLSEIEKELDNRGLDMNLNVKDQTPLSNDEKLPFITSSKEYVLNTRQDNDDMVRTAADMLSLADERTQDMLKEQIVIMKQIDETLSQMNKNIEQYENAETRQQQTELNYIIQSNRSQIEIQQKRLDALSEQMVMALKKDIRNEIKDLYTTDPKKAIQALQKTVTNMKNLDAMDIKYLSTSKFINDKYGRLVGVDNDKFATLALAQLENLKKVMSKNQTAVEIGLCEQWGEKPIFTSGEVLHPAEANRILANAEKQVQKLRKRAEKDDDYYPYSKCNITIYSVTEKGKLAALNTRIDIGDGTQKDISDHLDQIVKRGKERMEIVDHFKQSLKEKPQTKSMLPQVEEKTTFVSKHATKDTGTLNQTKWEQAMSNVSISIEQESEKVQESEKEQA